MVGVVITAAGILPTQVVDSPREYNITWLLFASLAGDSRPSTTASELANLGDDENMDTARTEDTVTENGDSAYNSARDTSRSTLHG